MNNMDFKEAAERYKKELLDMYKEKGTPEISDEKTDNTVNIDETKNVEKSDDNKIVSEQIVPDDPVNTNVDVNNELEDNDEEIISEETDKKGEDEEDKEDEDIEDDDIENRYPPPVIPDFILRDNKNNEGSEEAFGYLKVRVRTGNGGLPVEGNSVIVSETVDGKENLIKILVTNSSGETEVLRLPTVKNPIGTAPDDYEMSSVYNVSVFSEGFFSEVSRGVAIFDGITSVLNFLLIPEPFEYVAERPIVFENTEPDF